MFRTVLGFVFVSLVGVTIAGVVSEDKKWAPVEAEVTRIERECSFTITETRENGRKIARGETDSCNSTEEFAKYKANPDKRPMNVAGTAKVKVSYVSPVDQSDQMGTLTFNGRDEEFYRLKAHDTIKIGVAKDGSGNIRKL